MNYFSKNPKNKEEFDMNLFFKNKYSIDIENEIIFNIASKIFLKEINDIGLANILTNKDCNFKINKIKNKYFKTDNRFKNLYISDYLKEFFFKKNLKLIKYYISKEYSYNKITSI